MRWLLFLVLLAGCETGTGGRACAWDGRIYDVGDTFPAGDGCNTCHCMPGGDVACTEVFCFDADPGPDADPASCAPSGGCASGPSCLGACCGAGEICTINGCQCGDSASCGEGDSCEALGPVGGDQCGALCCGVSGPCPQ